MDVAISGNSLKGSVEQSAEPVHKYADLLVQSLERLGVECAFGIPGGAIEPFVDALARSARRGGLRCITTRHETGAAFMADGYYAVSGKMAVCFATTGPGATNLVTGIASAHANNIPLLVITAQTPLATFGRGAFQESSCTGTDILSIFSSITRYNTLISHPRQLEHKLYAAVATAMAAPRGPVHLSIPIDILAEPAPQAPRYSGLPLSRTGSRVVDFQALDDFYRLLISSRRTVFVIGNYCSRAVEKILDVAQWLGIEVVVTPHGKGLVDCKHPQYRGVIGFAGHATARDTLACNEVELVVAVGAALGEWASNGWDDRYILNRRLVHVDDADNRFTTSPMARLHVRGDLNYLFSRVVERLETEAVPRRWRGGSRDQAAEQLPFRVDNEAALRSDQSPLRPERLMAELPRLFPAVTRYLADTGNSFAWAVHYLHPSSESAGDVVKRGSPFLASLDFASMGWAIGSAVGVAVALPGTPVVCITGDGSYLMAGQEITVAVSERLPVIFLILNDSGYGMVKHGQRLTGAEPFGYSIPPVDFSKMAQAMGVPGFVVESVEDLQALDIKDLCDRKGPCIVDVRIDPEAKPPIGVRASGLRASYE